MKSAFYRGYEAKVEAISQLEGLIAHLADISGDLNEGVDSVGKRLQDYVADFENSSANEEADFNQLLAAADKLHLATRSSKEGDSITSLFSEINTATADTTEESSLASQSSQDHDGEVTPSMTPSLLFGSRVKQEEPSTFLSKMETVLYKLTCI
jgi:hypothetical protein